jgi:ABC-type oligopeptide transport system ATPase subunit
MSLLDVRNLTVDLPTAAGWIRPVNEVSFQLAPAESLRLVGESGSGKTMLALALMGLLPPGARAAGSAVLKRGETNERNLTQLNEKAWRAVRGCEIAMVFQEPMTSLNPVMRIGAQPGTRPVVGLLFPNSISLPCVFRHFGKVLSVRSTLLEIGLTRDFLPVFRGVLTVVSLVYASATAATDAQPLRAVPELVSQRYLTKRLGRQG